MRILWIDDDYDEQKEQDWFGNIREQHEVQSVTDFEDAYHKISNQLEQYDLIVIDINLYKEGGENESVETHAKQFGISPKEYLEEGGFHLYLKLLAQGFDTARIVFLTGNVDTKDDTADMIREMTTAMTTGDNDRYTVLYKALRTKMLPEQQQTFDDLVIKVAKKTQISEFLAQWHQEREASAGKVAEEAEEIETVIKNSQLDDDKQDKMLAFLKECKPVELLGNDIHNIYNRFEKRFREARLIPPKAIKKSPVEVADELQKWLRQFCERRVDNKLLYEYLTMRRGMLDVLNHIKNHNHSPLTDSFNEQSDAPINHSVFLAGLRVLLQSHQVPSNDEIQHFYLTLCDYLTKPFERFTSKYLYKGVYKPTGLSKITLDKEYAIPAYLVRNWIAHTVMDNPQSRLCAQDVGFIFLTVINCMFGYDGFKDFNSIYSCSELNENDLIRLLVDLQNQRYDYFKPIFDVISYYKGQKKANEQWKTEDFVGHMYASFLFCGVSISSKTKAAQDTNKEPDGSSTPLPSYGVKLTYQIDSNQDSFSKSLKSIAYKQLELRKFWIPSENE